MALDVCPVCDSADTFRYLTAEQVPIVCNELHPSAAEARSAPRADIELTFCRSCTHSFNRVFDPDRVDYTERYENALHYSARFTSYMEDLARRLVDRYALTNRRIVEIGCGNGAFLDLLCRVGDSEGLGFDPSYEETASEVATEDVTAVSDYYSDEAANGRVDFICARHVLEHLSEPRALVASVRRHLKRSEGGAAYFEVPNMEYVIEDGAVWDLIYEHYAYFTSASLRRLFESAGFEVIRVDNAYGGQFLQIEARPASNGSARVKFEEPVDEHWLRKIDEFGDYYRSIRNHWTEVLQRAASDGKSVVVWGAGSKGITLLNMLDATAAVDYAVDINPRKQGKYISGTGHQIISPAQLENREPDLVIIMNPIYREEIENDLRKRGLAPDILTV